MTHDASRREFLRRACAISATGAAAPLALNLAAIGSASAAVASDYKALVCVFLYGGNDYANTVVPFDKESYKNYTDWRPTLSLKSEQLIRLEWGVAGREYALAPNLKSLADIFNTEHKLAVIANVGTLIEPTTKDDYNRRSVRLPPKLFSHNDQQSFWQAIGTEGASTGWGGRMGDILASDLDKSKAAFTCISPWGNAVFLSGNSVKQYQCTEAGALSIKALKNPMFGSQACSNALKELVKAGQGNLMGEDFAKLMSRSIDNETQFSQALAGVQGYINNGLIPDPDGRPGRKPSSLDNQLNLVFRAIRAGKAMGLTRQVFFVGLNGFDNHDGLLARHPALLKMVGDAMSTFFAATKPKGVEIADQVTAFTASDFGRSWGNADGSDHGWGSFHFVLGGAVKGGAIYGKPPVVPSKNKKVEEEGGEDDVGQGRLIPTTSVDQMAATLGGWMGLSDSQLLDVLPNLRNFSERNLGFMKG